MFRRIDRIVKDLKHHAVVVREVSLGLYQAAAVLTRGRDGVALVAPRAKRVLRTAVGI